MFNKRKYTEKYSDESYEDGTYESCEQSSESFQSESEEEIMPPKKDNKRRRATQSNTKRQKKRKIDPQRTDYADLGKLFVELLQKNIESSEKGSNKHIKIKEIDRILDDEEPSEEAIMTSDLSIEEKKNLIELTRFYHDDCSFTHRRRIKTLVQNSLKTNFVDYPSSKMDTQICELRMELCDRKPRVNDIVNAFITREEKLLCLELIDLINDPECDATERALFYKKIQRTLAAQMSSQKEVDEVETQELISAISLRTPHNTKKKIFELDADDKTKATLFGLCNFGSDKDYKAKLDWYTKLPYRKISGKKLSRKGNIDDTNADHIKLSNIKFIKYSTIVENVGENNNAQLISDVYEKLNKELYGMQSTKEHVLQIINNKMKGATHCPIIALQGKPGVGKTKMAKAIANALDLPFYKIGLGGEHDSTIFKGSEEVWSGSGPGLLLRFLADAGTSDILVLLDEIDKLGDTSRGLQVQHSLLHILDPSQNKEYQDMYLSEITHDLSRILFVASMNDETKLDNTLRDRLSIVRVSDYSDEEKIQIMKTYTMPCILKERGFREDEMILDEGACTHCVSLSRGEGGMRVVEHILGELVSKISLYGSVSGELRSKFTFNVPGYTLCPTKDCNDRPFVITEDVIRGVIKVEKKEKLSYYM